MEKNRPGSTLYFVIVASRPRSSGGAEPSPAELPSKLQRIPEPARSEDLEDFNRIPLDFPRISSSAGAEPSSAEPERSSAEPEASSADVKFIEIS